MALTVDVELAVGGTAAALYTGDGVNKTATSEAYQNVVEGPEIIAQNFNLELLTKPTAKFTWPG